MKSLSRTCVAVALIVTCLAADDPVVPEGVVYKKASAEANEKAIEKIKSVFKQGAMEDDTKSLLGEKALICGAALWQELKADPTLAKIDGGVVTIVVPITGGKGVPRSQKMEGKLFQNGPDILAFWKVVAGKTELKSPVIRKLTSAELSLYWSMISFDITEPVYIVECGKRKVLLQFTSPEDLTVSWIDDLAQYHESTTSPAK